MPLGKNVMSSCVLKQTGDNQFALRHYTPEFRYKNPTLTDLTLSLEKPEEDGSVEAVLVGSSKVPFEIHSGFLQYVTRVGAGKELSVKVLHGQASETESVMEVSPRRFRPPAVVGHEGQPACP
jgi:hypothetical protein